MKGSRSYSNNSINLAKCWRDLCKGCVFFSWNQDKKECKVSNGLTEICVTPRGSECSQMIEEGVEEMPENFITVRANNCKEKNMTKRSDCEWENDLPISMDNTYRLKLVVFHQLPDNEH